MFPHFIYKPLQIEACTYQYRQDDQEKSFTIQKKVRDTIQTVQRQRPKTVQQRSQPRNQSSFKVLNQNNQISINKQSHSFYEPAKVQQLIEGDKHLLRRKKQKTDFTLLLQPQHSKLSYQRQIKREVTKLLDNKESLFRQVQSPKQELNERQEFTRKLNLLNSINSKEDMNPNVDTNNRIQSKIDQYLQRKSTLLASMNIEPKVQSRMPTSQSSDTELKVSQNFLMNFVGMEKRVTPKDTELEFKKFQYWNENSSAKRMKKQAIFSNGIRDKFIKMRQLLLDCAKKMKFMKLDSNEILNERVFLHKPYQREGSYMFFKGVEKNDIELVKLMLTKCRYYAYDVNENLQTALHICGRKGWIEIMKIILDNGAYLDQKDICGRTPLFYGIKHNKTESIKLLLSHKANPWSDNDCQYQSEDDTIIRLLKIARRLDILLIMSPYKNRDKIWRNYKKLFNEI